MSESDAPGRRAKTGGRVKGTPNRTTRELRTILKHVLSNEIANLPELVDQLKPADRAQLILRLMAYILPKPEGEWDFNFMGNPDPEFRVNIKPIEWVE